ncbi:MAG: exodeoxyribonuclease V subunit gamma [Actinomycetes bacterium]
MSTVSLFQGEGLRPLADKLLESIGQDSPLQKRTIVVPSPQVGQWLEQYVASQWGAIANWDVLLVDPFLANALYADPRHFEAWSTLALTGQLLAHRGETPLTITAASTRARNLREVLLWRPTRFEDYLSGIDQSIEAKVVATLRAQGLKTPWEALDAKQMGATTQCVIFGIRELVHGALLPSVVRELSSSAPVQVYLTMPSLDAQSLTSHSSLVTTWGGTQLAHWQMWRDACPDAAVTLCADETRVLRQALSGDTSVSSDLVTQSIQLHGTVGPGRQVEVARDVIARLVQELGIAPHQVRVVTTDPTQFAPLFDAEWRHPGSTRQSLQFEVADPSLARASFRLEAFERFLRTIDSHYTVNDFIALLSQPALLVGLGINQANGERLREQALDALSLGLDGESRSSLEIYNAGDDSGTWRRFSDRGLLASVFEERRSVAAPIAPLGVAEDRETMAAVAELIDFLLDAQHVVTEVQPLMEWVDWYRDIAERFIGSVPDVTDNGLEKIFERLGRVADTANPNLSFSEARDFVESLALSLGGGQTFGRGGVVVQGIDGLADAPFAVTCILGLDDDLIPSPMSPPAHLAPAQAGDPSPRARFRSSLLAQILSTTHRVVLFTTDRSVRDSSPIGLSVPLAELDGALRPILGPQGIAMRRHPRHGFSINIETEKVTADVAPTLSESDSFSSTAFTLDGAHAQLATLLLARVDTDLNLESDIPVSTKSESAPLDIDLLELERFLKNPQGTYATKFLGNARIAESNDEAGRTPRRSLSPHREVPNIKRQLVAEGLTREFSEMEEHIDDLTGLVAPAFRSEVELKIDRLRLEKFVRNHRADIDALGVEPSVLSLPPGFSVGQEPRELLRGDVSVYELDHEVLIVRTTTSSKLESAFLPGILHLSIATLATTKPVRLVVARSAEEAEAAHNAWVTLKWPTDTAIENATVFIRMIARIYDSQYSHPPVFVRRASLHALTDKKGAHAGSYRKLFGSKSAEEMWDGGFDAGEGESKDPINQLLLPFTFEELGAIYGRAFGRITDQLVENLAPLIILMNEGSSTWSRGVEVDDETL